MQALKLKLYDTTIHYIIVTSAPKDLLRKYRRTISKYYC